MSSTDYVSISGTLVPSPFGGTFGFTYTRTGHVYITGGYGVGTPGGAVDLRAGHILGDHDASDVDDFVKYSSVTGSGLVPVAPIPGGLGVGPSGGVTWGNVGQLTPSAFSGEGGLGIGTIGAAIMGTWSINLGFQGPSW